MLMAQSQLFAQSDTQWASPLKAELEAMADSLTANLKPWDVPRRTFRVERYGAKGDGKTMNTAAIQRAIDACAKKGGGVVRFGKGDYVTGTIEIKSGVMLEVSKGARILGSTSLEDYPVRIEDHRSIISEYYKFRQSLIYAHKAQRVGIRGEGEIYFRGEKKHFSSPQTIGEIKGRPLGIRMIECSNVVMQGIRLRNSAAWMQIYVLCRDLIFDGITVENQANFNNDGLDPDGCTNVIIRNVTINSEDDAMCLKGSACRPSRNVLIENSTFVSTCNAFKVGTDTQGDFSNVLVRNVVLGGIPESMPSIAGRESSTGITIATVDGGNVENMLLQNVTINQARCPIFVRIGNRGRILGDKSKFVPGYIKRIIIEDVKGERNYKQGSFISGLDDRMIEDLYIRNVDLQMAGGGTADLITNNVRQNEGGYPDAHQFSRPGLPAYGFFLRHVKGLTMENIRITPLKEDARPEIFNGGNAYDIRYNDIVIPNNPN